MSTTTGRNPLGPVRSLVALPLAFLLFGCQTDTGLKNIEVTPENQEEIQKNIQSSHDLTVEEVRLLDAYLERQKQQTGSAALPTGKTVAQLIEDERVFRGESSPTKPGEAAAKDNPEPDEIPVAQDSIFADDEPDRDSRAAAAKEPPPPPPPTTAVLPSGTQIQARLEQPLSSKRNESGERVEMSLEEDLIVDGQLLAPSGSRVVGRLTNVKKSGRVKGRAQMSISLYQIWVGEEPEPYRLRSSTLAFEAQGSKKEDAKKVGIGAGLGAVVGAVVGGGKGAAIGGVIGAGAGTGAVLATSGDEVEFKIEQLFSFVLRDDVEMKIQR